MTMSPTITDEKLNEDVWRALGWMREPEWASQELWTTFNPQIYRHGYLTSDPQCPTTNWQHFGYVHEEMERRGWQMFSGETGVAYGRETDLAYDRASGRGFKVQTTMEYGGATFLRTATHAALLALNGGV